MTKIGYAGVSTTDQDLDIQQAKLTALGCKIIRSEKVSVASRTGRGELKTAIDFLRPGDDLMVTRLDRLGRDTRDVLNIIHGCEQKVLVDRFGIFDNPRIADDLGAAVAAARHRYKNFSPVECVMPSRRLSKTLNNTMNNDDRWLFEPWFEALFRKAVEQIKAEL